MIHQIAKWNDVFETSESKRYKSLTWVAMPVGFSSHGYQSMIEEFGDDAPAIYGAWCALVSLAGTMPIRGVLASSKGIPLSISAIARQTFFPQSIFERLFDWAKKPEIGWIIANSGPLLAPPANHPAIAQEPPNNHPGATQQSPSNHPVAKQEIVELPYRTVPYITQQQQQTSERLSSQLDWDGLVKDAEKFRKVSQTDTREVPTDAVLAMAALTVIRRNGLASDIAAEFRAGRVQKPQRFVKKIIESHCEELGVASKTLYDAILMAKARASPGVANSGTHDGAVA